MNPQLVLVVISIYFVFLFLISWWTTRKMTGDTFFTGDRNSHWFLVSFGMIGASLSGVTFISVPGEVGNSNFYYFQVVLGYTLGYFTIAALLPLEFGFHLQLLGGSVWLLVLQNRCFFLYSFPVLRFLASPVPGSKCPSADFV